MSLLSNLKGHFILFLVEDMFGADDADWAIYRKIVRHLTILSVVQTSNPVHEEHRSRVLG